MEIGRNAVRTTLIAVLIAALWLPAVALGQDPGFRVIAHPSTQMTSVSRDQLAKVFLKKVTVLEGSVRAKPVDLAASSTVRAMFAKDVLHMSLADVKSYWQQQVFAGRGVPPPEKPSEPTVVSYVLATVGAVAYVSTATPVGAAKVLTVTD